MKHPLSLPQDWVPPIVTLIACLLTLSCSKRHAPAGAPSPTPIPTLPRANYDTARLFNGLALKTSVSCGQGTATTLETIAQTNSYEAEISLHVRWPSPATNAEGVLAATPELAGLFPELQSLLDTAMLSPAFSGLLERKERSLRANLSSLQKLPYRDSLFDCQTILELRAPGSSRPALLIQAIMNVNTDGSDGDRNVAIDRLSATYQPQTNYRWPKTGAHPNPCLRDAEARMALISAELGNGSLTPARKDALSREVVQNRATIEELKRWDFLVGAADPFIVLPSFMVGKSIGEPGIGDYAVVICRGKLYPAILGDMGPSSKIGEASLRLCREIDNDSGADKRPISRPEVTYLVFPGTAEKPFLSPDYAHWESRCRELWKELGGIDTAEWHTWTSLEKPWPTPTPSPTPSPATNATLLGLAQILLLPPHHPPPQLHPLFPPHRQTANLLRFRPHSSPVTKKPSQPHHDHHRHLRS